MKPVVEPGLDRLVPDRMEDLGFNFVSVLQVQLESPVPDVHPLARPKKPLIAAFTRIIDSMPSLSQISFPFILILLPAGTLGVCHNRHGIQAVRHRSDVPIHGTVALDKCSIHTGERACGQLYSSHTHASYGDTP